MIWQRSVFRQLMLIVAVWPMVVGAQIQFSDVTALSGVNTQIAGEGVVILDVNNDGWEDFFVADENGASRLYINNGNWQFSDATASAGLTGMGPARLALAADFNNDGWTDLFVGGINSGAWLWQNNGDGTFSDVTNSCGIQYSGNVRGGAWCDYDQNGFLDLYVADLHNPNQFYRNNGDGTFTEIAAQVAAQGPTGLGLVMGLSFLDYDLDGDQDLFMTQDGNLGNILLRREANGLFSDVSQSAGVVVPVQGMGVAVGDYDRDGDLDVYTTNLDVNSLFQNQGNGTFQEVAAAAGVQDAPQSMGWGTFFFDADNDGWLDIFANNQSGFAGVPNALFHNQGNGTFLNVAASAGVASFNDGIGAAFADLDNDGDLDMVLSGKATPQQSGLLLYRNDSPQQNWVQLTLHQAGSNPRAVDALVEVFAGGVRQLSQVLAGNGYASQNTLRQHFGLGAIGQIDSVRVTWPDGQRETFFGLAINQHHVLEKGTGVTGVLVDQQGQTIPQAFALLPNFPNPFNPTTTIEYHLPVRSQVELTVYSITGQKVAVLHKGRQNAGIYRVRWEAGSLSSGMYFIELRTEKYQAVRRAILLR